MLQEREGTAALGISIRLMSALGQTRRIGTFPECAACPLRSDRVRISLDLCTRRGSSPQFPEFRNLIRLIFKSCC
jgi:hypothetical protein